MRRHPPLGWTVTDGRWRRLGHGAMADRVPVTSRYQSSCAWSSRLCLCLVRTTGPTSGAVIDPGSSRPRDVVAASLSTGGDGVRHRRRLPARQVPVTLGRRSVHSRGSPPGPGPRGVMHGLRRRCSRSAERGTTTALGSRLVGVIEARFCARCRAPTSGARRDLVASLRTGGAGGGGTELRAEQARLAERARIAREMHDVLAHKVSLIALHAGGSRSTRRWAGRGPAVPPG